MISDSGDRLQAITALAPFARVRLCQSSQDLQASIANDALTGVICECRDSYGLQLAPGLVSAPTGLDVPTLILLRPLAPDALFFSDLVCSGLPALARIRGQVEMGDLVRSVVEGRWLPEANAPIIRALADRLGAPVETTLVIAIIAASRRLRVRAFAQLAQMSERTLQRRLASAGLPSAARLLAWGTTLHSAWRLEIRGEGVKETSAGSGFPTREAFTGFIRRHAGCTASDLARRGSFLHKLETFLAEITSGASSRSCSTIATTNGNALLEA
jgi:AraC-like DNA-binding protein